MLVMKFLLLAITLLSLDSFLLQFILRAVCKALFKFRAGLF